MEESHKNEVKKLLKTGAYFSVGIFSVTAIMLGLELSSSDRIYPKTQVGPLSLGYEKVSAAKEKIEKELKRYLQVPMEFQYKDKVIALKPEDLGIRYEIEQNLNRIPVISFKEINPLLLASTLATSRDVPLKFSYDHDHLISILEEKTGIKELKPQNAKFALQDKNITIIPEKRGINIDRKQLFNNLEQNLNQLSSDKIFIETVEQEPKITAAIIEEKKEHLLAKLDQPILLKGPNKDIKLKLSEHLDAVNFIEKNTASIKGFGVKLPLNMIASAQTPEGSENVELNTNLEIEMNLEKITPYLEENIIADLEKPTSPVNITKKEDGTIQIEGKGEDGQLVPRNRLAESIALAANSSVAEVEIPIIKEKAPITIDPALKELGIKDLIATGHSAYAGSPANRKHNISVGIQKYNGIIVKPGEEFSFNTILGEVDGANGYLPEKVIKKNKAEYEYGGGICQVSTTAYRAALLAGLPITERAPHSWKVSYYAQAMGNGLDSTIYLGVVDLKFVNDTPGAILIQSYTEGTDAYFKFYGTDDGRTTELDGPHGGGLNYYWYRTVTKDGKENKEKIVSNYKPIPPPDPPPAAPAAAAPVTT